MLLDAGAWPIELLAMQEVYKDITKVTNISDQRLPKQTWNIGCKLKKTNKGTKSSRLAGYLTLWNGLRDRDATKYVIMEDILLEALRIGWQYAKMSKLEHYNANMNSQYWSQYRVNMSKCSKSHLTTPVSLGSRRALTLLQTSSCKLGIEVASPKYEYHSLIACSMYNVIREKYDDMLNGHDNVSVILKCLPRMMCTYVHAVFWHREFLLQSSNPPS